MDESGKYSTCMVQFKPLVTALTVALAHYYVHVFSHPSVMIETIIIQIQHKCTSAHDRCGYLHQVMSWIAIVMYVVYAVARLHQEITGGCTAQFCMVPPTALICMAPHTKLHGVPSAPVLYATPQLLFAWHTHHSSVLHSSSQLALLLLSCMAAILHGSSQLQFCMALSHNWAWRPTAAIFMVPHSC